MKDNIAVASVILTIIAVVLLALIEPEPAARALDAVGTSRCNPWRFVKVIDTTTMDGSRDAPDERSAAIATAETRRRPGTRNQRRRRESSNINNNAGGHREARLEDRDVKAYRGAKTMIRTVLATSLLAISLQAASTDMNMDGSYYSFWQPKEQQIGYLFAGFITRQPNPSVPDMSTFTVGAQINAGNAAGVNQGVWGIATEAWAYPGSRSPLFGIEATSVNMEPSNSLIKVAFYATFKNRPDTAANLIPVDPMNVNSQAVRIDAQAGTGFERGIVFGPSALSPSPARATPAVIDLSEMSLAAVQKADLIRLPDGCSIVYLGHGQLGTRCVEHGQ